MLCGNGNLCFKSAVNFVSFIFTFFLSCNFFKMHVESTLVTG